MDEAVNTLQQELSASVPKGLRSVLRVLLRLK